MRGLVVVIAVGCGGGHAHGDAAVDAAVDDAPIDADLSYHEVALIPVVPHRDVDLLFVIDDAPGTAETQLDLRNGFPELVNELNAMPAGLPNVHIGVVTSDLGTKGADDANPGPGVGSGPGSCAGNGKSGNLQVPPTAPIIGNFISDIEQIDGTRMTNYTGTLFDAFGAIVTVGSIGCSFGQPLEAATRALNGNPANVGFLRPDANLVVIFVGDADDCSMAHSSLLGTDPSLGPLQPFRCTRFGITCDGGGATPDAMNEVGTKTGCHSNASQAYLTDLTRYTTFLNLLKPNPSFVLVGAIVGDRTPFAVELRVPPGGGPAIPALANVCAPIPTADPAVRTAQLAETFTRSAVTSVCNQDLAPAFSTITRQLRGMLGDPCLTRDIALPPDCMVFDEAGGMQTMLPPCGATPCWRLTVDPTACPLGQNLRVTIERSVAPPPDTVVSVRCRL